MYLFARAPLDLVRSKPDRKPATCVRYRVATCVSRPLLKWPFHWRGCAASSSPEEQKPKKLPRDEADLTRKPASGTIIGRLAIEALALMAGATLLMFVAIWKAATVLVRYFWHFLLWLSKVRRLGRWVLSLAVAVARSPRQLILVVVAAVQHWISALVAYIRTLARRRADDHVVVPAVRVPDDETSETVSKELVDMRRELREVREMIERRESAKSLTGASDSSPASTLAAPSDTVNVTPAASHLPDEELLVLSKKTRLILLRHAKSEFDRSGRTADHERALSEVGQREAQLVGAELKRRGWLYNSIVCSNALRTMQTLDMLGIDPPKGQVVVTESLYYAVSGDEMATVIDTEAPEGLDFGSSKLVVAHSPGICELIERLTGEKPIMGTACAALLEYPREHSDSEELVGAGSLSGREGEWRLVDIIRPAMLY